MREIAAGLIAKTVARLLISASFSIGKDIENAVSAGISEEESPLGRSVLSQILDNYKIAREDQVAICQDTGMATIFIEIGQDAHVIGGDLETSVNEGVRRAYKDGYLRKSVVTDPLFDRTNTGDNTPAILHTRIIPGDRLRVLAMPKGFGSENMSRLSMLTPADGLPGVKKFIIETVLQAGPNPCPPIIAGVGIGGTMEKAALMAKEMTARAVGSQNNDLRYAQLEAELLKAINDTGIGPAGTGGRVTALAVHIAHFPTHIAGLPVAVNLCCHAARHAEEVL
ncbi:MAG: fumarate hydratase [Clostridia bacterium]|nr:fumarate hydratase [Clostridia bacterium]